MTKGSRVLEKKVNGAQVSNTVFSHLKSILKPLVIIAISLVISGAIYSRIVMFFAVNRIFFSANENGTVKQNNQSDFKVSLK